MGDKRARGREDERSVEEFALLAAFTNAARKQPHSGACRDRAKFVDQCAIESYRRFAQSIVALAHAETVKAIDAEEMKFRENYKLDTWILRENFIEFAFEIFQRRADRMRLGLHSRDSYLPCHGAPRL